MDRNSSAGGEELGLDQQIRFCPAVIPSRLANLVQVLVDQSQGGLELGISASGCATSASQRTPGTGPDRWGDFKLWIDHLSQHGEGSSRMTMPQIEIGDAGDNFGLIGMLAECLFVIFFGLLHAVSRLIGLGQGQKRFLLGAIRVSGVP